GPVHRRKDRHSSLGTEVRNQTHSARNACLARIRIHPPRHTLLDCDLGGADRAGDRRCPGPANPARFLSAHSPRRHRVSGQPALPLGHGQSQHPLELGPLSNDRQTVGTPLQPEGTQDGTRPPCFLDGSRTQARDPLHAQARQLAQPDRNLVRDPSSSPVATRRVHIQEGPDGATLGIPRVSQQKLGESVQVDLHRPTAGRITDGFTKRCTSTGRVDQLSVPPPYFFFLAMTGSRMICTDVSKGGMRSVWASNARASLSLLLSTGRSSMAVSKFDTQI